MNIGAFSIFREQYILNNIHKFEVVSFDIYDTLLKRNVVDPIDVFSLVELKYNTNSEKKVHNFAHLRITAEKEAIRKSIKEDVDIYEIYSYLDLEARDELLQIELQIEREIVVSNLKVKSFFDYVLSLGKRVIIISDMYLPRSTIEGILQNNGYLGYEKIYVSSELGRRKSTGTMFDLVLSDLNISSSKIVHIGDAIKGDFLMPLKKGINSLLIRRSVCNTLYAKKNRCDNLLSEILYSFINNHVSGGRLFRIGYETLGPVLYGFCKWIHEEKINNKLSQLLFFSRDGQLIYKCYKKMYPEDNIRYVYFSRRSLTVPIICKLKTKCEVLSIIPVNRYTELSSLLARLGIVYDDYAKTIETFGYKKGQYYHKEYYLEDEKFDRLYKTLLPQIMSNSQKEYDKLSIYFDSLECNGKVGLVDIGWEGTIQTAMEKFLSLRNSNVVIQGLYCGIMKSSSRYSGYLYSPKCNDLEDALMSFSGLFEMFLSADHGSVFSYDTDGSVIFCPFEYDVNAKAKQEYKEIKEVQNGALSFVDDINADCLIGNVFFSKEVLFKNLEELGTNPKMIEANHFGDFYFFDTDLSSLAKPNWSKIFCGRFIMRELSRSNWKIGYLKRLFGANFPYLKIYSFLKRRVKGRA